MDDLSSAKAGQGSWCCLLARSHSAAESIRIPCSKARPISLEYTHGASGSMGRGEGGSTSSGAILLLHTRVSPTQYNTGREGENLKHAPRRARSRFTSYCCCETRTAAGGARAAALLISFSFSSQKKTKMKLRWKTRREAVVRHRSNKSAGCLTR